MCAEVTAPQLEAILKSLKAPEDRRKKRGAKELFARIVESGWASIADIEDIFYLTDTRLDDARHEMSSNQWCELFELPITSVYHRPKTRQAMVSGSKSIRAADVASLLIQLEQLGFAVDPAPIVESLLPSVRTTELLTDSELSISWFEKTRHKCAPRTISVERPWPKIRTTTKLTTATGYKIEAWLAADDRPIWLQVSAPKHRRKRPTQRITCEICGYDWTRGEPDSSAAHRREHKKRLAYLDPKPVPQFVAERAANTEAELVDQNSPRWKHREMYRRALAFKREFSYDFVQWLSPKEDDDPGVQGVLFSNPDDVIVGACAFRIREHEGKSWRGLQWIWIAPKFRRSGILTARWAELRRRFGDFHVEGPVSEAMQAFLRKMGDEKLMRW
ncbi:GNAT family N-acetyltransferase [Mesorhizobium silamurunense]|uniref:GNAT family N-acetyltransferase n=1 Tax=Mesorhizobium silamurunense TaxID=499528 RepID=UPI001784CA15|nr:GNAT family N-acetyltransferase [Mesorhizobium silamurunense]